MGAGEGFYTFNFGHAVELGTFLVAFAALYIDRKKDWRRQVEMHVESQSSIKTLTDFHVTQTELNKKRDEQISELKTQTALLHQTAENSERRVRIIEERCFRLRPLEKIEG